MICLGAQKAHKHKHICRDRDIPSLLGFMIKGSIFAYVLFWGPIYVSLCRFMITPGAGGGGLRTAASTIILRAFVGKSRICGRVACFKSSGSIFPVKEQRDHNMVV